MELSIRTSTEDGQHNGLERTIDESSSRSNISSREQHERKYDRSTARKWMHRCFIVSLYRIDNAIITCRCTIHRKEARSVWKTSSTFQLRIESRTTMILKKVYVGIITFTDLRSRFRFKGISNDAMLRTNVDRIDSSRRDSTREDIA